MTALAVRLVGWLMRRPLTLAERNEVVIHILDSLKAVPLGAIMVTSATGELLISGKPIDMETGRVLVHHARIARENKALNIIREQVQYEAFMNTALARTHEDLLFYRAAIWWCTRVDECLALLAPGEESAL